LSNLADVQFQTCEVRSSICSRWRQ